MTRTSLNGVWALHRPKTGETYPATVPGVVHTDLLAAGQIEYPYYRDNERKYAWVGREDWVYSRGFEIPAQVLQHRRHSLVCEGLDTFAAVTLNGVRLGETENMFRRYEYDVTGVLREGKNDLTVSFASPQLKAAEIARTLPFAIPCTELGITGDVTHRNLIRKCQCHGGWDWGPSFLTSGIWKDIYLVSYDDLRIDYVKPVQFHDGDMVQVRTTIYLDVARAGAYDISAKLAGREAAESVTLGVGKNEVEIELTLDKPEKWWPLGYGRQMLHDLTVTIAAGGRRVAEETIRLGLRRVELVRERDAHGESFYFKVNGLPVFLKGYDWIPADSFTSRMTREVYADLIESAALANCNALRVWGGGLYEHDDFYDLCDERGVLVWQDFMFACAMYPWDDGFLANVAAEAAHQMRRLARHPSLLLWCGNNECETSLDWYEETRANRDRFVAGYHRLYLDTLGRLAARECPDLPYWPSSPCNGPEEYGDPNDCTRGDVHYWEVWHGGKRFSQYLTVRPRLASEFGFQSVPSVETLSAVLEPEDLNISSPMMDYRQRSPEVGNKAMVGQMMQEYRLPMEFGKFVYLSQVQQAMAMKIACEHWRRLRPLNMGTVIWQLNDIWQGNSWSSLEYGGKWKVLHSVSKRFFAPVLLSLAKSETGVEVWATSDLPEPAAGRLNLEVWSFPGDILRTWPGSYALGAGESRSLFAVTNEELAGGKSLAEIFLVLRGGEEDDGPLNWEFLAPAKVCPLPGATINCETRPKGDLTEISLATDRPAFHVWLEIPGRRGVFGDNAFILLPGHVKKVVYSPRDGRGAVGAEEIGIMHLRETY